MNTAELVVKALEEEGVTYVFGVPGEEVQQLLFALDESSIEFIPTRHEQGAAFIANVWGRLTGRAGVCLSTLGPGATNLVTGVADASLDKAPLVALTAQGTTTRLHHESHQVIDVLQMMSAVTEWNGRIVGPAVAAEAVRSAFAIAEREKPSATHIELPENIAQATVPEGVRPMPRRVAPAPVAAEDAIDAVAEQLAEAKRPLLVVGHGVIRAHASDKLSQLAESFGLPVVTTLMAKGAIDDRNSHSLFTVGLGFVDHVDTALRQADLLVCIGYDVAELPPRRLQPGGRRKLVHIDSAPPATYADYQPEASATGRIDATLSRLYSRLEERSLAAERNWWTQARDAIVDDHLRYTLPEESQASHEASLTIPGALHVIREALPDDGLLISDVGSHKMWIARNFPAHRPGTCIISNGMASMGIAIPGAIAASLVHRDRKIVACMGDGGALMNVQELETAARVGAKFVAIVFNDNDYGLISWKQRRERSNAVGTTIQNPDFPALARAFGIRGVRAETARDLTEHLRLAIDQPSRTLIEVPVDPSVNDALVARLQRRYGDTSE
ncbi:MAG: acetolactate synthase large subunit [Myxococcota bacterium]